jgi:hypothetical protein
MWVKTRGDQPTKEDYEALVRRVEVLEKKLAEQPKRGRPTKEENKHG